MRVGARHRVGPHGWAAAVAELADLVLARGCGGCGAAATRWCPRCAACLVGPVLRRRLTTASGALDVRSAVAYDGVVRTAVVAWKDRDRADLTPALVAALRPAAREALTVLDDAGALGASPVAVVPAPSSASARRQRGHQPVRDLAAGTALALRRRGTAAVTLPVLRQHRGVRDQAGLSLADRGGNLAGALWVPRGWRGHLRGRPCLLVDDVVTTGATLVEAARALHEAGAGPVVAVTLASTTRRDGGDLGARAAPDG